MPFNLFHIQRWFLTDRIRFVFLRQDFILQAIIVGLIIGDR